MLNPILEQLLHMMLWSNNRKKRRKTPCFLSDSLFALSGMPPPDLLSTRVPTQGDGISLGQGASTASHQEDSVPLASVSSLELGGLLSGISLGKPTLKKKSSAK